MTTIHPTLRAAIDRTSIAMRDSSRSIRTERWQGVDISRRPEAEMREILGWDFKVPMPNEGLDYLRDQVKPNLPWADDHFAERVCGFPMNPGEQWKNWPWARSASTFLDAKGRFEVSYMERIWGGQPNAFADTPEEGAHNPLWGIRGRAYGDMNSIIELLKNEPYTRQAYLPLYWPEDTGAGGRVMCSLGYHWLMRGGFLHVHYPIRSCDFYRHFRDDIYLCVRLTMWLLDSLQARNPEAWTNVRLGYFSMWIGSLHIFVNDYRVLFKGQLVSGVGAR